MWRYADAVKRVSLPPPAVRMHIANRCLLWTVQSLVLRHISLRCSIENNELLHRFIKRKSQHYIHDVKTQFLRHSITKLSTMKQQVGQNDVSYRIYTVMRYRQLCGHPPRPEEP